MTNTRQKKTYPRMNEPLQCILAGGWAAALLCLGVWGLTDGFTTWRLPFWKMELGWGIFIALFLAVWFTIPLFIARLLILGLQQVRIDQEEVQLCIGPFVLRRLHFSQIRTVVRTGGDMSEWPMTPLRTTYPKKKKRNLVFCTEDAEEIRKRSRSAKVKRKADWQRLRMEDQKNASNEEVKRYFERRMLFVPFWMEWSTDAEETLRKRLTTTVFIL